MGYRGAIFDLDGVLVDTARFHYAAWQQIAGELGFAFSEQQNERLKGVSRMRSLEILLETGGLTLPRRQMEELAEKKNKGYLALLQQLDETALLPGAKGLLEWLRQNGIKTAIGSASKNTPFILDKLGIAGMFDVVVDGNVTTAAKPDPEVFRLGLQGLALPAAQCVVFEDAAAGVEAALAAGCSVVGVGLRQNLPGAQMWVANLGAVPYSLFG